MAKPAAGQMAWRFRFERRELDQNGDRLGAWGDSAVTLAAKFFALRGSPRSSEEVFSERLQGRQPIILTVRDCAASRLIASDWRAVDARTGAVYGVKAAAPNSDDIAYIDILAEAEGTNG
jgi:hypothetical protein